MVELNPLRSQKQTNDPDEIANVSYSVELSSIVFKSAELKVMSDWGLKGHLEVSGDPIEVGTVTYGLKEAEIEINFGASELADWARRVSPESDPFVGRAEGCVLIWSETRFAWVVQPLEGSPMRVRMEDVKICTMVAQRGAFLEITVKTDEDNIVDDFRMRRSLFQHGALVADDLEIARERLFSLVLSNRTDTTAIFSYQKHKLQ